MPFGGSVSEMFGKEFEKCSYQWISSQLCNGMYAVWHEFLQYPKEIMLNCIFFFHFLDCWLIAWCRSWAVFTYVGTFCAWEKVQRLGCKYKLTIFFYQILRYTVVFFFGWDRKGSRPAQLLYLYNVIDIIFSYIVAFFDTKSLLSLLPR